MTAEFGGKTVIVTGAAHGFGRAIALAFSERGASVWACDVIESELEETRRLATSTGGACQIRKVDVSDQAAVDRFAAAAATARGRVDILVNNAGGVLGPVGKPHEQVSTREWQGIFDGKATTEV